MKVDLIQCTVRIQDDGHFGNLEVVKSGPSALRATEIPLLRAKHDLGGASGPEACCIQNARVVGQTEIVTLEEAQRLTRTYGKIVQEIYPNGRGMPSTIADCDLPLACIAEMPKAEEKVDEKKSAADRKKEMREALEAAGVEIPPGNLSIQDYEALMEELEEAL